MLVMVGKSTSQQILFLFVYRVDFTIFSKCVTDEDFLLFCVPVLVGDLACHRSSGHGLNRVNSDIIYGKR